MSKYNFKKITLMLNPKQKITTKLGHFTKIKKNAGKGQEIVVK